MIKNPERLNFIFDELSRNPHQSAEQVEKNIIKSKNKLGGPRGLTSEVFAEFLVKKIPEVTGVNQLHVRINSLDADLEVEFINADNVYLQVKTSEFFADLFRKKIEEVNKRRKIPLRFVAVSTEVPFDELLESFIGQVNAFEGRKYLRPVNF